MFYLYMVSSYLTNLRCLSIFKMFLHEKSLGHSYKRGLPFMYCIRQLALCADKPSILPELWWLAICQEMIGSLHVSLTAASPSSYRNKWKPKQAYHFQPRSCKICVCSSIMLGSSPNSHYWVSFRWILARETHDCPFWEWNILWLSFP